VANLSFAAKEGTLVALMGPSGTGKTTILRAIAGLEPVSKGRIEVRGRVGMVLQFHHLFAHMPAHQNVWLAPVHVLKESRTVAEQRARALLADLGVADRADAYPHELSGGEAQRVAIARALAMDPRLLLMDEPTASLDPARRGDLGRTLRALTANGRTVLMATHDVDFARACADRVIQIESGRIVGDAPAGAVS
jgi:ABC-type polar amino acid transport system ATPase subunit